MYHSHINVEVVSSQYTIKYLHNYIHKKDDAITLYMGNDNTAGAATTPQRRTITATNDS